MKCCRVEAMCLGREEELSGSLSLLIGILVWWIQWMLHTHTHTHIHYTLTLSTYSNNSRTEHSVCEGTTILYKHKNIFLLITVCDQWQRCYGSAFMRHLFIIVVLLLQYIYDCSIIKVDIQTNSGLYSCCWCIFKNNKCDDVTTYCITDKYT